MRFMMMAKSAENSGLPPKQLTEAMAKLAEAAAKGGTMVGGGMLGATALGARVRLSRGKVTLIDGPFTEAKEVIGGDGMLELRSKEEAIEGTMHFMELHKKHWPGWEGETEIRQVVGLENSTPGT